MSAPFDPELAAKREKNFDPELERQKYLWMGYGALASGLLTCAAARLLSAGGLGCIMALVLTHMLREFPKSPFDTQTLHQRKAELVGANPNAKTAAYCGVALGVVGMLITLSNNF